MRKRNVKRTSGRSRKINDKTRNKKRTSLGKRKRRNRLRRNKDKKMDLSMFKDPESAWDSLYTKLPELEKSAYENKLPNKEIVSITKRIVELVFEIPKIKNENKKNELIDEYNKLEEKFTLNKNSINTKINNYLVKYGYKGPLFFIKKVRTWDDDEDDEDDEEND